VTATKLKVNMDKKLIKSEKAIEGKTKKEFKGLLKEDHKLDHKRERLETAVHKLKSQKKK
jgi:hypothetical protein